MCISITPHLVFDKTKQGLNSRLKNTVPGRNSEEIENS